jgi:hypothetical protein
VKSKNFLLGIFVFAIFAILFSAVPRESQAIPPFARKYATACSTCHVVFPKLNQFGRQFRAAGYRIPVGEDMFVKDEPAGGQLSLGANAWKKMFPEAIWPSSIAGTLPVGAFVDQRIRFNFNDRQNDDGRPRVIFEGIHEVELLVGGTFGERFSFFGDPKLWEGVTDATEIGRLFIQYNRSPGFNLRFGILEPRAIGPFSKHRQWIRLNEHLMNNTPSISPGGDDLHNFSFRKSEGFEFFGAKEYGRYGIEYAAGILNGKDATSSKSSKDVPGGSSTHRETNSDKDWYVSFALKIGGMGVLGLEEESEDLVMTDNWRDDSVKIGGFFYNGVTDVPAGFAGNPDIVKSGNHFIRTGLTADIFYGDANIMVGAQFMRDTARDIEAASGVPWSESKRNYDAMIYEIELDYVVYPWLLPAIRYELFDPSNYNEINGGEEKHSGFQQVTANLSLLGAANIKMMFEYSTRWDDAADNNDQTGRVSFNWTF